MLTKQLKLKLTKKQENQLNDWLLSCQSIYNFGIRTIELNAQNKIYFSKFDFTNLLVSHFKKLNIPSHTIQGVLNQSYDAGISQLREFLIYKGDNHGRKVSLVDSKYTTMTCSSCLARSGPTGLSGLDVRNWECSVCGAFHDRDVNAAMVILDSGLGYSLVNLKPSGVA